MCLLISSLLGNALRTHFPEDHHLVFNMHFQSRDIKGCESGILFISLSIGSLQTDDYDLIVFFLC